MSFIFEKIYSLIYNLIINLISYYLGERYRMILLKLTPKIGTIKRFTDVLLPTWNIKNFNNFNVTITEIGFAKCERNFFIKHISFSSQPIAERFSRIFSVSIFVLLPISILKPWPDFR